MIGGKIIVDAVVHPYDLAPSNLKLYPAFFYDDIGQGWRLDGDEFSQAHAQGVPAPWSALRETALTPCA